MKKTTIILLTAFALSACGDDGNGGDEPVCGNDILETGEECDGTRLDGMTCQDFNFDTGTLSCSAGCTFDTSACENFPEACGNGDIDAGEDCDGENLNGQTCQDLGYPGGVLACSDSCTFDEADCQAEPCGNGQIDTDEECDGDELGGAGCADIGFDEGTVSCTDLCLLDYSGCACTDDNLEENDSPAEAANLAPGTTDLTLCNWGSEEDWFQIDVTAGQQLLVLMQLDSPVPDVDLELSDELGHVLDASNQSGTHEQVYAQSDIDQTLFVRISAYNNQPGAAAYTLTAILDPGCLDHSDCLEGEVCVEYACVTWACDDDNPCPDGLVCDGGDCVECVTAADCPDPDVYSCDLNLCVYGCVDDANEPDDVPAEATVVSPGDTLSSLRLCGEGAEDWFAIDLEALHEYQFALTFTHAYGDVDAFLYTSDELDVPVGLAQSYNDDELLVYPIGTLDAGTYYLQVLLKAPDEGQTYALAVTDLGVIECAWDDDCPVEGEYCLDHFCGVPECLEDADCTGGDRCVAYQCVPQPAGDTCDDVLVIDQDSYSDPDHDMSTYRNDLDFEDDTCTGWPVSGKDVIYQVTLAAGESITAYVEADFDVALYLIEDCGPSPMPAAACLAGADENLNGPEELIYLSESGGTYHLVVDAFAPIYPETGSYSLSVEIRLP